MEPLQAGDPRHIGGIEIVGRLGAGGFGTVYLGSSPLGRWVAVKVLNLTAVDTDVRRRFARESRAGMTIDSVYVASLEEVSISGNPPYLVSEYIPGPTLAQASSAFRPLTAEEFTALAVGLAQALKDIHSQGVIHRDVKPANVILSDHGPVVVDLGIAKTSGDTMLTQQGIIAGTPYWMAPEQANGEGPTPASDIWSWGACLRWVSQHHTITLGPEDPMIDLVQRALSDDPQRRPTTDEIITGLAGTQSAPDFIAPRWAALRNHATYLESQLPTQGGSHPTLLDGSTLLDEGTQPTQRDIDAIDDHTNLDPEISLTPDRSGIPGTPRRSLVWLWVALGVAAFLATVIATVLVGVQWLGSQQITLVPGSQATTPVVPEAPTPTVTVTGEPNSNQEQQPLPDVTVTQEIDPYEPRGGEQELVDELALAMNLQDWSYVNALCNPQQTCEVQFTNFFAPRYSRGQWVETVFSQFYSCRFNVPFDMQRGCTNTNRWVGNIFFTCFKDGSFGYQKELTSFTFTYVNGYPRIERFDPVALINRAEQCY